MHRRFDQLWAAVNELELEVAIADKSFAVHAIAFMSDPGLARRDAFHAALAVESDCKVIVSSDPDYDRVSGLRRLAPTGK